jgi:hypothetical protein
VNMDERFVYGGRGMGIYSSYRKLHTTPSARFNMPKHRVCQEKHARVFFEICEFPVHRHFVPIPSAGGLSFGPAGFVSFSVFASSS